MSEGPSVTNADERNLVQLIELASRRIVYMVPGITERVVDALSDAWRRLRTEAVSVILDVDPEVCRLGYGFGVASPKTLGDANGHKKCNSLLD